MHGIKVCVCVSVCVCACYINHVLTPGSVTDSPHMVAIPVSFILALFFLRFHGEVLIPNWNQTLLTPELSVQSLEGNVEGSRLASPLLVSIPRESFAKFPDEVHADHLPEL